MSIPAGDTSSRSAAPPSRWRGTGDGDTGARRRRRSTSPARRPFSDQHPGELKERRASPVAAFGILTQQHALQSMPGRAALGAGGAPSGTGDTLPGGSWVDRTVVLAPR